MSLFTSGFVQLALYGTNDEVKCFNTMKFIFLIYLYMFLIGQRNVTAARRAIPRTRATERVRNRIANRITRVIDALIDGGVRFYRSINFFRLSLNNF